MASVELISRGSSVSEVYVVAGSVADNCETPSGRSHGKATASESSFVLALIRLSYVVALMEESQGIGQRSFETTTGIFSRGVWSACEQRHLSP